MSTEYEWNGLRVRRDGEVWQLLMPRPSETRASYGGLSNAIIAELDKLYPKPKTVTLDWYTFTLHSDEEGCWWHNDDWGTYDDHPLGKALDRIWELENEDDR